jgi:hypothetical protein
VIIFNCNVLYSLKEDAAISEEKRWLEILLFRCKVLVTLSVCCFYSNFLSVAAGQGWQPVGDGFNWEVRCLYSDTIDNLLYCGGGFKSSGALKVRGISKWIGLKWDSLQSGFDDFGTGNPQPTHSIIRYENKIYVLGVFSTAGGIPSPGLARWNGASWDTLQCFQNISGGRSNILNGELYIYGNFTNICGQQCRYIAKFDGTNWTGIDYGIDTTFGLIGSYEIFQGEPYIAGNLLPIKDIFKWDGTQAVQLGQGILGGISFINDITIYQNELYVAGYFWQSDGNAGDNIMKWNGTSWTSIGGGLNNQVNDLKVYGGYLYAVGAFDHAGGIPASRLARWDGISWSAIGPEVFDNAINCIEFYNNELYVAGGFWHVDTLTVNRIAKYTGPLSISDFTKTFFDFNLSSNPAGSIINVNFSHALTKEGILIATDVTGREHLKVFIPKQTLRKEIDIAELSSGIYFLTLVNESGSLTRKMVKE